MIKESNENKELKSKIGLKCTYAFNKADKKSSPRQIICNGCGTMFKTIKNTNYCLECEEIFYDEP